MYICIYLSIYVLCTPVHTRQMALRSQLESTYANMGNMQVWGHLGGRIMYDRRMFPWNSTTALARDLGHSRLRLVFLVDSDIIFYCRGMNEIIPLTYILISIIYSWSS